MAAANAGWGKGTYSMAAAMATTTAAPTPTTAAAAATAKMRVVLDGSNIAWRHGGNAQFSLRGALLAFRYFRAHGHVVTLFLPEGRVEERTGSNHNHNHSTTSMNSGRRRSSGRGRDRRAGNDNDNSNDNSNDNWTDSDNETSLSASDEALLHTLLNNNNNTNGGGMLVLTPDQDYDDAYLCAYARQHGGVVVSNDVFRDLVYQASADGVGRAASWDGWLSQCRLSFTFGGDEFLPNPAFNWRKAAATARRLRLP